MVNYQQVNEDYVQNSIRAFMLLAEVDLTQAHEGNKIVVVA